MEMHLNEALDAWFLDLLSNYYIVCASQVYTFYSFLAIKVENAYFILCMKF